MTKYTFANLDAWAAKCEKRMDAIVKQSTSNVIDLASKTATGLTRGGVNQRGYVPRDTGALAASLVSTLSGSTAITQGAGDYSLVVGNMEAGDVATFAWTAPYARRMHYGDSGRQGWFWVTEATAQWDAIVSGNVQKAKAMFK
mgnify:CR=1 FL=1